MHNGVNLYNSAVRAVRELQTKGKRIVFLSNAPRPKKKVVEFLKKNELKEGLLTISCERIIPEHKKKKLIEIK